MSSRSIHKWPGVCQLNVAWRGPWWFNVKVPKEYTHNGAGASFVIVDEEGVMVIPPLTKWKHGKDGGVVLSILLYGPGVYRLGVYGP